MKFLPGLIFIILIISSCVENSKKEGKSIYTLKEKTMLFLETFAKNKNTNDITNILDVVPDEERLYNGPLFLKKIINPNLLIKVNDDYYTNDEMFSGSSIKFKEKINSDNEINLDFEVNKLYTSFFSFVIPKDHFLDYHFKPRQWFKKYNNDFIRPKSMMKK